MKNMESYNLLKIMFPIVVISCNQFFLGCGLVFSSILFVQLRNPNSPITLNAEESSWVAGVAPLVSPIGFFIIGVLADKIGRLKAVQVSYIPIVVSWLILTFANSYETLLIGRIIGGLVFGSIAGIYVYVAEVCRPDRRQLSFSIMFVFIGIGMVTECQMAMFFDWHTISAIITVLSVASFASLFALPESPVWLRTRDRNLEADNAEEWFDLEPVASVKAAVEGGDGCGAGQEAPSSSWSTYTCRTVWLPALITMTFVACQQGTGLYVMTFYTADVFRDFGIKWDGIAVLLFMSVSRMIGSVIFSLLYNVKRRTLAAVSCVGMAASLIVLIVYLKMFKDDDRPPNDYVPIAAFALYMFFGLVGMLPLPWSLGSEVFPRNVRGTMNGFVLTIGHLLMFITVKVYPSIVSNFGIENVWIVFTAVCLASVIFCTFIMPETKGVLLKDILASFEPRKKRSKEIVQ